MSDSERLAKLHRYLTERIAELRDAERLAAMDGGYFPAGAAVLHELEQILDMVEA